jgi:cytochrome c oxidase assembly protein subunit 15
MMIALVSIAVRPRRLVLMGPAFTALALTAVLAGVGSVTSTTGTTTGVSLANLLGGMGLAALLWWLVLRAGRRSIPAPADRRWPAAAVLGLVVIQLAQGALLSTTHAATQCSTISLCPSSASDLPAALHISHRVIAITLLGATAGLTVMLTRRREHAARPALALTASLCVQAAIGVLMVALDFPFWLALAHNAGALLVLLSAVWMLAVY